MLRPTAESTNESTGFSETLKIQYLDIGSIPVISTKVRAPGEKPWSSLIATDASDFKRYSDFERPDKTSFNIIRQHSAAGFRVKKVRKLVRAEVAENSKKHGHS